MSFSYSFNFKSNRRKLASDISLSSIDRKYCTSSPFLPVQRTKQMTLPFVRFLLAFLIQQPVDAHAICDLGFPGVCFARLSPLNYSITLLRAAEKPQQVIL